MLSNCHNSQVCQVVGQAMPQYTHSPPDRQTLSNLLVPADAYAIPFSPSIVPKSSEATYRLQKLLATSGSASDGRSSIVLGTWSLVSLCVIQIVSASCYCGCTHHGLSAASIAIESTTYKIRTITSTTLFQSQGSTKGCLRPGTSASPDERFGTSGHPEGLG